MKSLSLALTVLVGLVILAVASGVVYVVDETRQVVITQFGEPVGDPIRNPGLHFKLPFIQHARYFEKRYLEWDGFPSQIPTSEKKYISVDTFARWRIVDPLHFLKTVGNEQNAQSRLDDIIDGGTRDVITRHPLIEIVRSSNRQFEAGEIQVLADEQQVTTMIKDGREVLTREILRIAAAKVEEFGIELQDVRIKTLNYRDDVRRKVYDRMISERKRAASQFRSEGRGRAAGIQGQMERDLLEIRSEAERKAQEIRGQADAEASRIYAKAYNSDPEFYAFTRTLDTYRKTLKEKGSLVLSSDGDFLKYLTDLAPRQ